MISQKDQTVLVTFRLWFLYDQSTMNILLFLLIRGLIKQYIGRSMIIRKLRLCLAEIEAFVNR